jgi:gamma-glutamylputrescine oxidase
MSAPRNQWGASPWNHQSDLKTGGARSARPDVVIVGAGFTGTSAAYHLSRLDIATLVLEAGAVADGASGRTGGLVLEGTATGIREGVDHCVPGLKHLVDELAIDCELNLPGCWEIAHRTEAPERMLPWSDGGKPVAIAKTVVGGTVEPARLNEGLARAAIAAGSTIREGSRVVHIEHKPELAVYLENEVIRPGWIVVAVNAWMSSIIRRLPPMRSSLTFACATEPLEAATLHAIGLDAGIPFYTADLPYLWGRTMRDRRVIFGAGLQFASPAELERTGRGDQEFDRIISGMHQRVRKLHPALREIDFSASWAGPIAFTEDMIPVLGSLPECPSVLVAGAYAGHGVALSVRAGALMAAAIARGESLPSWGSLER